MTRGVMAAPDVLPRRTVTELGAWPATAPLIVAAFLSGVGAQVFVLGWHVSMQENVPDQMLSRAYSYDQLGSLATVPLGQLALGPLAVAFGIGEVLTVAGVLYVGIALLTVAAGPVRALARPEPATASTPAALT